ncbi:MAG TPA: hypothetical protein VIM16_18820 [Mucilaginibacter sp.]
MFTLFNKVIVYKCRMTALHARGCKKHFANETWGPCFLYGWLPWKYR